MDLIVAVLVWIGALVPGENVTPEVVLENESAIEYYSQDPDFVRTFNASRTAEHIGMLDLNEGD
jgi:hypothetical protein